VLAVAYLVVGPSSADLAAQEYRAGLGLTLWDNGWYGGHHMPGYSVLFPLLASAFGARMVGAVSAVAAAWVFERLLHHTRVDPAAARVSALWFAVASSTTLITGRLTFSLGVAFGLAAVLVAVHRRTVLAGALSVLAALSSPVAACFVALIAAAWWLHHREWRPVVLAGCALVPAAVVSALFPENGSFPFVGWAFWPALVVLVCVLCILPGDARLVRITAALYVVATILSFLVATPMGGNVVRLGALFAGPVVAALLWSRDRRALALIALPLIYWQWVAPVDDWIRSNDDPSVHRTYYTGVLSFLDRQQQREGPFRVEIPFTDNHWEARWVAPQVSLARGWERQVDLNRNFIFYDGRTLTPDLYRHWLNSNAIRYVALADAPIDYSAAQEAQLVRDGLAYLRPVWHDAHWQVFRVVGGRPLATGAARVTALGSETVRLTATRPGTVDLRVRFSPYWRIVEGRGCVAHGAKGGWTKLTVDAPGTVLLRPEFALRRVRSNSPWCTG
jgi:hypothetical protein